MTEFMKLVREMRTAQKEYFEERKKYHNACNLLKRTGIQEQVKYAQKAYDALQRSKALEDRVDEEIHETEAAENTQSGDVIIMADGRKLVQGNLFDNL